MTKKKKTSKRTKGNSNIDNAFVVSKYFGFQNMDHFDVSKEDIEKAKSIKKGTEYIDKVLRPVEEQIALFRTCKEIEDRKTDYPLMIYQNKSPKGSHKKPRSKAGEKNISLHIIGTPKSVAEALLIKTAISILEEEGIKDISLEINSVGGKDSISQFMKELNSFYRKNMHSLSPNCKQVFKDGPHALITCGNSAVSKLSKDAPSSLDFLNESNRKHFGEVIEFLEDEGIPYEINKEILGDPYYSSHTIFTIIDKKSGKIVATGTRCDQISKKIGLRKDFPGATLTLSLNKPKKAKAKDIPDNSKYNFCFIQLGDKAKFKGLKVIEVLRKARIPVYHAFGKDKLSGQLQLAGKNKVPYIILMGQKEAMENSVVIRDTVNHSQVSVPINELEKHLKNLVKKIKKAKK